VSSLVLNGVSYTVGERAPRTLLDGIDMELSPGLLTALSGPSGSGKTTLLSIAGGLVEPTTGTTSYDGASMWGGTGDPRPEVAFVLQVYGLVPILSARENVSVALRARGMSPAEADERAEAALARFHIADLGDRQVEELSGGQMQRVALARGLGVDSGVLLADEPTSELDEGNRSLVLRELRLEAERGAVVVVATHDPAVVDACDRHFVLDEGRLVDHVAPVDAHRLGALLARPERVVEEALPTSLEPAPAETEPDEASEEVFLSPLATVNGDHPDPAEQPGYVGRHAGAETGDRPGQGEAEPVDPDAPFRRPSHG
jgi:putative ABC transport system ATP-binding protein